jgi:thiamine pyrophosphokinase
LNIFEENNEQSPLPYGIVVLNCSKASLDKWLTEKLWSQATIRACADGGSNELRKFTIEKKDGHFQDFTPDFISGDLDSITPETRQFYEETLKVPVIETADQDATDFTKCLQEMEKKIGDPPLERIYVFCTFGRRFDQAMSIIHTLYLYPKLNIFLISEDDVTFLLKPGLNRIYQIESPMCGKYCSLIPFAGPIRITTNGLRWNLNEKMELNYHTLISTSNTYCKPKADFVTIDTPQSLIWSMTFANDD